MKKSSILVLALLLVLASPAYAHVLQTSGSVGAVLHIDPNDDPQVNTPSTFHLEFQQGSQGVDLTNSNLQVLLRGASGTLLSLHANDSALSLSPRSATFTYTFTHLGAYTLIVSGKSFTLIYNIDIDDAPAEHSMMSHWPHIILFGIAIGFGLYVIVTSELEKRRAKR